MWRASSLMKSKSKRLTPTIKSFGYIFSLPYRNTATMADNEEDLVDYDEEEEEQNVAAEEDADAEGKEVKK